MKACRTQSGVEGGFRLGLNRLILPPPPSPLRGGWLAKSGGDTASVPALRRAGGSPGGLQRGREAGVPSRVFFCITHEREISRSKNWRFFGHLPDFEASCPCREGHREPRAAVSSSRVAASAGPARSGRRAGRLWLPEEGVGSSRGLSCCLWEQVNATGALCSRSQP